MKKVANDLITSAKKRFVRYIFLSVVVISMFPSFAQATDIPQSDIDAINGNWANWVGSIGTGFGNCSITDSSLSSEDEKKINQNEPVYQQAAQQTNVPWQLLAAIHYRETGLSTTESNLFQVTGGGSGDFLTQAVAAGNFLQHSSVPANLPSHRSPLAQTGTDPEEIKDTLFSYNGRAAAYAQQAQQLGFNPNTQPYEGSPYVMNNYDAVHHNMGIITHDGGGIDGIDTRLGAFTVYSILLGASAGCGNGALATGTVQELADQILKNKNITYDYGPNGEVAQPFKDLQAGNLATNNMGCPTSQVSTHILQEILLLAQQHKIQISSLTTDHPCGNVHTVGRAVDIDYMDGKSMGSGTGPNQMDSYNTTLANTLMADALPALPSGSAYGDCDGHNIPTGSKKIVFFPDNCNHVHTTVPPGQ